MKTNFRLAIILIVTVTPLLLFANARGVTCTYESEDVPKDIPDQKTISSSLTIPDSVTIQDVDVVVNITHTWDTDLDVYLIAPDGTQVELFTDVGGSENNFIETHFDDEASMYIGTPPPDDPPPFTDSYKPEGMLSVLDGKNAQGTWQLKITDDANFDSGVLLSWRLIIDIGPLSAEPSNPSPANGEVEVAAGTCLSWDPDPDSADTIWDVYLTDPNGVLQLIASDVTEPSFCPGELGKDTVYLWQVVAKKACHEAPGPIWLFRSTADPGTEGLVAYYAFENDANDSSGNGLHGTVETIESGEAAYVAGVDGMAIDLLPSENGTKGPYVNCGADPLFDLTDAITVGAWANFRSVPDEWRAIVAKGDSAWRIGNVGATTALHFGFCGYGSRPTTHGIDGATEIGFDSWHYVCGTYDITDGAKLYVDGVLDVEIADTAGIALNTFDVTIGANMEDTGWKPYRLFDGQIDEVRIYDRALSVDEVRYLAGERPVNLVTEGLVAQYAMEGDATDSSGNGLDGTLVTIGDANDATFVAGVDGMAIDLLPSENGTVGPCVNCGADPLFDLTDAITVGAWANFRSVPDEWRAIVAKGDSAWRIGNVGATTALHFGFCGYGSRPTTHGIDGTTEVGFDSWHYVCGTYDITDGAKLYVDGVLDVKVADTAGIALNTFDVTIGANMEDTGWKPYRLFDGQIDEVRIYDRALSVDEVRYLAGERPVNLVTEGLVAQYAMEGDATDSSGNGLDGTLVTIGDANDATFVAGVDGMAIDLLPSENGTVGPCVNCGADPLFDLTDAITVGAWANFRSVPDEWRAIVAKGDSAWRIGNVGATTALHFGFCGYGSRPTTHGIDGVTEIGFDSWHYVCGTYDITDGAKLYVDGVLDVEVADTAGIALNTFDVTIGANMEDTGWKPYRLFDGMIDEVRIYDRALSAAEVLYHASN